SITSHGATNQLSSFLQRMSNQINKYGIFEVQGHTFCGSDKWDILFYGDSIPHWFRNRSMGNHVMIRLPSDGCHNKFRGYGTCIVYKRKKPYGIPGYIVRNFDGAILGNASPFHCFPLNDNSVGIHESHVIWLHYNTSIWGWKEAKSFASFTFKDNEDVEVKECAVRLFCDQDIQEADSMIQDLPTPTQKGGIFTLHGNSSISSLFRHPLALRLHRNTKMKAYPKYIDWGNVIATNKIMDGYFMPKYENTNLLEDDSWIDIILDDVYDTFYRDGEEEAKVAKANDKGKGKLVENNEKGKEAEHHHLKVNKDNKGKGKLVEDNGKGKVHDIQNRVGSVEVDLAREIKAKQVDDHDDHDLDTLDLEKRIKKLKEDFSRLLKAKKAKESNKAKKAREAKKAKEAELAKQAKKAKKAREAVLKVNKAKKAKEKELKAKKSKEAKEAMLAELKAKKDKKAKNAKETMLAEVVQISSDEDDDEDPTASTSIRSRAPTASTSTRSRAPTAYTSKRSRALIASTSNAKAASTAPKGYGIIAMTRCVICLFALNAPPPSATRKRKST
nr:hypothetical protein [Tanacetum cinerariifolium]